jgi:hypothetical protein
MLNMDFSKMPWGGVAQGLSAGLGNLAANSGPDPLAAHNAAHEKTMNAAGYSRQANGDWGPAAAPSLAPQSPPVMLATQPEPLRDTIQNAMPEQSPVTSQPVTPQPAIPSEGAIEPSLPSLPGQLPQQAGLTKPAQYQYQPGQMQTVLDTLRQGAQIQ